MANNHFSARSITIVIISLCALFAAGAYSLGVMNMKSEKEENTTTATTKENPAKVVPTSTLDTSILEVKPYDIVYGNADAPVTVVEYASLSCSHCAHFHTEELDELKKTHLENGKARLVLRQFPLNAPALKAAQLVGCAEAEEQPKFIKVLFQMQNEWAFNAGFLDSLKQIAAVGGISNESFDKCMSDKAIEDALIAKSQEASEKLNIQGTPSFFVNGKPYAGAFTAEALGAAIDSEKSK